MVGSQGPYGSVLWNSDPSQPGGYTQTTQLSPEQQALYNSTVQAQQGALGVANQQIGRVGDALSQTLNSPQLQGSVQTSTLNTGAGSLNPGQGIQSSFDQGMGATYNPILASQGTADGSQVQALQPSMYGGNNANPMNFSSLFPQGGGAATGGGGYSAASAPSLGSVNTANGVAGAGQGLTNSFDAGGPIQSGVAGLGPTQSSFNQGQAVQGQIAGGGPMQTSVQGADTRNTIDSAGNIQRQMGPTDFTADRNAVTDAVYQQAMSRLNPGFEQENTALMTRLANQGLGQNSEAYKNAFLTQGRVQTDARNQALYSGIQQGAAEQNQLFNQSLAQGNFANAAQQQQYGQNADQARFYNDAQGQQFAQNVTQGSFANAAQGQQFGQNLAQGQFANQAAGQQYAQNLGAAQFGNDAAQQRFDAGLAQGTFANTAQAQQYGQNLGAAQFANQAQGQGFDQAATSAGIQNQGAGIQQQGNIAQGQLGLGYAQLGSQNQQQAAALQSQQAIAQMNAQLQGQGLQLSAQDQAFNQQLQQQQLANQTAAQQWMQNQGAATFNNQAQGQQFGQQLAGQQASNGAAMDQFNMNLAAGQFANQSANQQLQQDAYVQNQPLNQFNSLMSSGQVQTPQGIQYSPTQVGQTDVMGAYALNQQQQNANYQAAMQQNNGLMGGLFALGSAGLQAAGSAGSVAALFSDRRLKRDICRVATRKDGLGVYAYRYQWDAPNITRIGVMADEVLKVNPFAVRKVGDYLAVNYEMLEAA